MTTWEKELKERRAKDKKTAEAAQAKLRAVFALMGYTIEPDKREDPLGHHGPAVNVQGGVGDFKLVAWAHGYQNAGRVVFAGHYPEGDYYTNDLPQARITCALDKTPEQLAADIKRRLLPVYLKGQETARKRLADAKSYYTERGLNLAAVLGRNPTDQERDKGESDFAGLTLAMSYGKTRASRDDVSLELHGLAPALAARIVRLLAEAAPKEAGA